MRHWLFREWHLRLHLRLFGGADQDPVRQVRRTGGRLRLGEYGHRLAVPELVLAPREIDFPRIPSWTPRRYAGACVETRRPEPAFPWARLDDRRSLAYCSLGTYSSNYRHRNRFFQTVLAVFRQRPDWQLVLQAGEDDDLPSSSDNVIVSARVPQLALLERASLFITHGGFSSIRESVYFGVPMIVFPCWLDQHGNAARVLFHRLGLRGDIRRVDTAQLSGLVDRVTGDAQIRASVRRMQETFRAQEDCRQGVDFIEKFLGEVNDEGATIFARSEL